MSVIADYNKSRRKSTRGRRDAFPIFLSEINMTDSVLPTVKQELERKTIELLEDLTWRKSVGRLSKQAFGQIAGAVWTLTSGLVELDIAELVQMAIVDGGNTKLSRNFLGCGCLITLSWLPDSSGYALLSRDAITNERTVMRASKSEIGLREPEMEKICNALLASSYTEIL